MVRARLWLRARPGKSQRAARAACSLPLAGKVRHYNNTPDTVGYGWNRVLETRDFYQPAPRGGLLVEAALVAMALRLVPYGHTAIGTAVTLPGVIRTPVIACEIVSHVLENLHQHMPDTYLAPLGAPPLPFAIGFGAVVAPDGGPAAAALRSGAMPVVYVP